MRRAPFMAALLLAVVIAGACSDDEAKREGGDITSAGPISVFDLRPGDCLNPEEDVLGEIDKITAVPCDEPHKQEVYAVPDYPDEGGVYPGEAELQTFADASCLEAFVEYTGTEYLDSNLYFSYLHPSVDSWNSDDDRTIACVIVSPGEDAMTGSVKGTTTTTIKGATTTSTARSSTTASTTSTTEE